MVEIISVRFKSGGKPYYFNPEGQPFEVDDGVIVETTRGMEYATCVQANSMIDEMELIAPLRPVVRRATEEDRETLLVNRAKEAEAFEICKAKIVEHGLDMKLVSAEYSFDGSKILFLFTADVRVDFRALVKDQASSLHARIELRQIGVRDEAKLKGGLGICGRPFCCASFLDEFQPVSIKMAKTQNLSLNPTKISGTCGRLMCCLKYEQEAYEDLVKTAPKIESFVETPDGAGNVTAVNLLRQTVQVRLESSPETPRTYHNTELSVVRSGKGKRPEGYVEPPPEELAHLRRPPEEPPREDQWEDEEETAGEEEWEAAESVSGEEPEGETQRTSRRRRRGRRAGGGKPARQDAPRDAQSGESTAKGESQPQKADTRSQRGEGQKGPKEGAKAKGGRGEPQKQPPKGQKAEGEKKKGDAPAAEGGRAEGSGHRRHRRHPRGGGGSGTAAKAPAEGG